MMELVRGFLDSGARNEWLYSTELEVYVRHGYHWTGDRAQVCLDVANAQLLRNPSGAYLQFILELPQVLREHASYPSTIYVENVNMPGLDKLFSRLGYTCIPNDCYGPCFYKRVK